MPTIFNKDQLTFNPNHSPLEAFAWSSSDNLSKLGDAKDLNFDIKILQPGKYSYPYHFHRNAEELFVILSGSVTLRTPDGFRQLHEGDIAFFEKGSSGAHQLFNHTDAPCSYLDLRTLKDLDICEYPDTGKVNILDCNEIFLKGQQVGYFDGEEDIITKWADAHK